MPIKKENQIAPTKIEFHFTFGEIMLVRDEVDVLKKKYGKFNLEAEYEWLENHKAILMKSYLGKKMPFIIRENYARECARLEDYKRWKTRHESENEEAMKYWDDMSLQIKTILR